MVILQLCRDNTSNHLTSGEKTSFDEKISSTNNNQLTHPTILSDISQCWFIESVNPVVHVKAIYSQFFIKQTSIIIYTM